MDRRSSTAAKIWGRTSSSTPTIPTSMNYYYLSSPPFRSDTSHFHFMSCQSPPSWEQDAMSDSVGTLSLPSSHYHSAERCSFLPIRLWTVYFANNMCWLIDRVFSHALNTVNKIRTGVEKPPGASRLKLYGLYKQSMGAFYFRSFLFEKVSYTA